jgi:hypothetical protein
MVPLTFVSHLGVARLILFASILNFCKNKKQIFQMASFAWLSCLYKFLHFLIWPPVKFDDLVRKQDSSDRIRIVSMFWRDYGCLFRISKANEQVNLVRFRNNYFGVNCWCSKSFIPTVRLSLVKLTYGFNSDCGVGSDANVLLRAP